jgi:acyl-CoA reductase-like NAD-dependent aldehyde dehydrogenase
LKGTSSTIARELKTINPATEEIIGQYEIMTKEQIDDKVKKAQSTFQVWKSSIDKRTDLLYEEKAVKLK